MRHLAAVLLGVLGACSPAIAFDDAGAARDARVERDAASPRDSGPADASARADASPSDATAADASSAVTLSALRDRLFATFTSSPCESWTSLDESQRAVFLTLTHRLSTSRTPDGRSMLEHIERLYLVLGGGSDGGECGGAENNRLFLGMDDYLHARMIETWDGESPIDDGGGSHWKHTGDIAGPHDPFDASDETDTGLRCTLFIETSSSRPPTAQAHFFLEGSAEPVERGDGISLAADPRMLEIDHDFDCIHRSNPTCSDFEERYRENHGDFECEWVPSTCAPEGSGCYRAAIVP